MYISSLAVLPCVTNIGLNRFSENSLDIIVQSPLDATSKLLPETPKSGDSCKSTSAVEDFSD